MSFEFVVIDGGVETAWIDPVVFMYEYGDSCWLVDNGLHIYRINKIPGRTVAVRDTSPYRDEDDDERSTS